MRNQKALLITAPAENLAFRIIASWTEFRYANFTDDDNNIEWP